ncbi:MAG TPA: saccharopine dehydrogenase C-terminal domain-containing protein [Candidatus Obscuribacterales bacterium]
MKFLVLGAGRMGYAAVYDLIRSPRVEQVFLSDSDGNKAKEAADRLNDSKIVPVELDICKFEEVVALMSGADVTISCVPFNCNYDLAKAALEAQKHFVDLGGNEEVVKKEFLLDEVAKERDVTIMPDLGLAPGLVSMLAMVAADSLDELYEIRLRVGGLPVEKDLFLGYSQLFAIEGLINEYAEDVTIIRDGQSFQIPSLTEVEKIEFPKPFGTLEAFATSGGISTLPATYAGKVQHLDYKTIRYPGHCEQMNLLKELGLMSLEPVDLPSGKIVPRELFVELLSRKMAKDEPDAVLVRVTVTGVKDKKPTQYIWECIEFADQAEGLSAMMRMTAFPASIIAQMIARGDITERGVLRQETSVPVKLFLAEMASRGIRLTMSERAPVPQD